MCASTVERAGEWERRGVTRVPVRVECYAGYKADETPRAFTWEGRRIPVREVQDRWYQGDRDPEWPVSDYFRVVDDRGDTYLLVHDREADAWFLLVP